MDEFMGLLRSKAHPLQVNGQLVSGRVYAQLAEAYCTALNAGAVPQLVTAWQGIARAECQKAYDSALAAFQGAFKVDGAEDEAQLYDRYTVRPAGGGERPWDASASATSGAGGEISIAAVWTETLPVWCRNFSSTCAHLLPRASPLPAPSLRCRLASSRSRMRRSGTRCCSGSLRSDCARYGAAGAGGKRSYAGRGMHAAGCRQ